MVDGLLDFIAGGSAPERRLPVERALCEQLHVSRSTVREALSTLAQLGVVVTRGKGRYGSLVARGRSWPAASEADGSARS